MANRSALKDAFCAQLAQVKVVSFDVFDTLFVRLLEQPEAVFTLIAQRLNRADFINARQVAQQQAFAAMHACGRSEISLEDIYQHLSLEGVDKHSVKALEYALELSITCLNPEVAALFEQAKQAGKTVVLTSDMYLPEAFFKALAERYALAPEQYFISSACNATKRDTGALFEVLLTRLGVAGAQVLHIGDNPQGDIAQAAARGLKTLHYQAPAFNMPEAALLDGAQQVCAGLSRYGAYQVGQSAWQRLGWQYGAAVVHSFFNWLVQCAKTDRIEKILYVARDGFVLQQLHQQAEQTPDCVYLRGSRVAFTLAAMDEQNFVQHLGFLLSGSEHLVLEELFARIGVELPDDEVLHDLGLHRHLPISEANRPLISTFLLAMQTQILRVARETRRGLYHHLHSLGVRDGMRLALVDVGWSGSTQVAFERALKGMFACTVQGYYLALNEPCAVLSGKTGLAMRAMCESLGLSAAFTQKLYANRAVVELFFGAPEPTTIGYRFAGQALCFVTDVERGVDDSTAKIVGEINQGIVQYIDFAAPVWSALNLPAEPRFALHNLQRLVSQPSLEQVRQIGPIYNWDAWASSAFFKIYFAHQPTSEKALSKPDLWPAGWQVLARQGAGSAQKVSA